MIPSIMCSIWYSAASKLSPGGSAASRRKSMPLDSPSQAAAAAAAGPPMSRSSASIPPAGGSTSRARSATAGDGDADGDTDADAAADDAAGGGGGNASCREGGWAAGRGGELTGRCVRPDTGRSTVPSSICSCGWCSCDPSSPARTIPGVVCSTAGAAPEAADEAAAAIDRATPSGRLMRRQPTECGRLSCVREGASAGGWANGADPTAAAAAAAAALPPPPPVDADAGAHEPSAVGASPPP
mmetsp:Transcript_18440/g.52693  ORF Transcript_18440/g.52693 Transcript_18440/m.52693 type:complete len:242 (+) Transcript_18440:672-1397(+)